MFYNDDDNIKYVTIANSHDDIYIVTGMFYGFESGTDDRILYKKGDSKIEVLMKDNKEENDASVIYRALYNFYRNGGKEFFIKSFKFSSSDHLVEDLFGLKPEDCFVAKPRSIECADLLFGDTEEKFPIKEENLLIGPAESAAENPPTPNEENNLPVGPKETTEEEENLPTAPEETTKEENNPEESVEEEEENLLLIAPKEEENTSEESVKEEEEENLLVGPNEAAKEEKENLPAEPEETVNESDKTFNAAKQFSKPYNAGCGKNKANKKLQKKLLKHVMPPDNFTIEFDCDNKKKSVMGIVIDHITIWKKNNKIDFKKSFVSFTEYRCKDVPVKKDKKFGAFKKYLENKKMKRTWFLPGLFNCKVSVA
ncbi:MAG: hypothetical protein SPF22_07510 [Candidatus Onthovivens sp.]|nr:hypothetical protein [Candidatus Onthovivens sp.]